MTGCRVVWSRCRFGVALVGMKVSVRSLPLWMFVWMMLSKVQVGISEASLRKNLTRHTIHRLPRLMILVGAEYDQDSATLLYVEDASLDIFENYLLVVEVRGMSVLK